MGIKAKKHRFQGLCFVENATTVTFTNLILPARVGGGFGGTVLHIYGFFLSRSFIRTGK